MLNKWEATLQPKVKTSSEAYVIGLLKYALTENEVWARAITTVKRMEPIEYFVSKFEDIETTREGDEKFKRSGAGNQTKYGMSLRSKRRSSRWRYCERPPQSIP